MQEVYDILKGMVLNAHSSKDRSPTNATVQPQSLSQCTSFSHFAGGRVAGDASDCVIQTVRDSIHLVLAL
jgi:hypothetical protein